MTRELRILLYLLKVNNEDTRKRYEICSKLINEICSGVFIINFEHISYLVLVLLLLTLNMLLPSGKPGNSEKVVD